MNSKIIVGVIAVVIVGGLGLVLMQNSQKDSAMMEQKAMEEKTMMEEKAMMEKKAMEEKAAMEGGAMMEKKDGAMMSKGSYEKYDPSKLALANDGKVVLFFKASWCPTCRALDADIKANLGAIPGGVTILEVDYDNSTELKKKYGVTMQHTLVQVDAQGNLIMKWSGGNTLTALVEKLK